MAKNYSSYLENIPNNEGNFGDYGGAYLPPQLVGPMNDIHEAYLKSAALPISSMNCARFANTSRAARLPPITPNVFQSSVAEPKST